MTTRTVLAAALCTLPACASHAAYQPMATPPPPAADLVTSVYLVGDAGYDSPGRDAVMARLHEDLTRHVGEDPEVPALVVFLGDNIYDVGARPEHRSEDLAKLSAQVEALVDHPTVRGVFLPGNHDWGKGAPLAEGALALEVQQAWLDEIEGSREVGFLPDDECPGPGTVHVAADVHVVFMDTEWLLRQPEGACGGVDAFYRDLTGTLRRLEGERVVLASHHPMATGGPHGGNVGVFYNGPLLYYLAVKAGLSVQDIMSPTYGGMLERMEEAISASRTRPLAWAAGHDHSLQVIRLEEGDGPLYQLVSGSASKSSPAGRVDGTRFASSAHGFMRLDFTPSGSRVVVFALDEERGTVSPVFACPLTASGSEGACPEAPPAEGAP